MKRFPYSYNTKKEALKQRIKYYSKEFLKLILSIIKSLIIGSLFGLVLMKFGVDMNARNLIIINIITFAVLRFLNI